MVCSNFLLLVSVDSRLSFLWFLDGEDNARLFMKCVSMRGSYVSSIHPLSKHGTELLIFEELCVVDLRFCPILWLSALLLLVLVC